MNTDLKLHNDSLSDSHNNEIVYNKWADTYDTYVNNQNYLGPKNTALHLKHQIDKLNINSFKILDFGCGTGLLGLEINKILYNTYTFIINGIDISTKMLEQALLKNVYHELFNNWSCWFFR